MLALLVCLVVGISDGDTIKVRCGEPGAYQQITIRLAEIDAPEKGQPFGQRSKQTLSDLCFGVQASIKPAALDRYRRTVARIECNGLDASAEQVRQGMAWAYTHHLTDRSIKALEDGAKASGAGLWANAAPVAPWEWRKAKKDADEEVSDPLKASCVSAPIC